MRIRLVALSLALSASQAGAQWTTNWFSDFNSGLAPNVFTGLMSSTLFAPSGIAVYGPRSDCSSATYCTGSLGRSSTTGYDNHAVTLGLTGLGAHTKTRVSFTGFFWDSWDGTSGCGGACAPDYFRFSSDPGTLMDATFSNFGGPQSYAGTAAEQYTLGGVATGWYNSSVYNFSFEFLHSASTLNNSWDARGLQGWGDEGWTIDNVKIETYREPATGVVPEPGTYALMATGLIGLFGVARRRR